MLHVNASVDAQVEPQVLFELVSDLGTYPRWLEIVGSADPESSDTDDSHGGDSPAWLVDLRAQMGPLRRSKRLRMVRTVCEAPNRARFERRELDGRTHSDWVLSAHIDEVDGGVRLTMDLRYGGSLWLPALDRILKEEIRRSSVRLVDMVKETN